MRSLLNIKLINSEVVRYLGAPLFWISSDKIIAQEIVEHISIIKLAPVKCTVYCISSLLNLTTILYLCLV